MHSNASSINKIKIQGQLVNSLANRCKIALSMKTIRKKDISPPNNLNLFLYTPCLAAGLIVITSCLPQRYHCLLSNTSLLHKGGVVTYL